MTYLNEGLVQGRRQGMTIGYEQGYNEGYNKGFQQGSDNTGNAWENSINTTWEPALRAAREERNAAKSVAKDLLGQLRALERRHEELRKNYWAAEVALGSLVSCLDYYKKHKQIDPSIIFHMYEHYKKMVFEGNGLDVDADFWKKGLFHDGEPGLSKRMQEHYEEFLEWKKAQATAEPA